MTSANEVGFHNRLGRRRCSPTTKRAAVRANRRVTALVPDQSGVYIFRNSNEEPIYVGKARSLSHRLRSYFYKASRYDTKISHLLASARSVETIVTNTEGEALNLENRLIKQMTPRYNVLLRDDKTYPYIKLTVTGQGACVTVTRRRDADGAIYSGPFFPASLAHQIAKLIRRDFLAVGPVPSVADYVMAKPSQRRKQKLKAGAARAFKNETEKVRTVRSLLEGHLSEAAADFSHRMLLASNARRFEEAARYKHHLGVLKQLRKHLNSASFPDDDTDVIGLFSRASRTAFTVFQFRKGKIATRYDVIGNSFGGSGGDELLPSLVHSLYSKSLAPLDIVAPISKRQREIVEQALSSVGRRGVLILAPAAGPFRALEDIASRNAQSSLEEWFRWSGRGSSRAGNTSEVWHRLDEEYPRGWQSVGRASGGCRTDGSKRRAAPPGLGKWWHFVAGRCSRYACPRRSDFVPPVLPQNMSSSGRRLLQTNNDIAFQLRPMEIKKVTIRPPDHGEATGESPAAHLMARQSLINVETQ